MKLFDKFFEYLGLILILVNCILYISSLKKDSPKSYKIFTLYLLVSCILFLIMFVLAVFENPNLFISHYYFISQFVLLSLFYKQLFKTKQKLLVNYIGVFVFITLIIQYIIQPERYFSFNLFEIFLCCTPLVLYSIIHFYNSLARPGSYMYINTAVLIYISSSTLIFILGDFLSGIDSPLIKLIWTMNKVLYVIYLSLILMEWKKSSLLVRKKLY